MKIKLLLIVTILIIGGFIFQRYLAFRCVNMILHDSAVYQDLAIRIFRGSLFEVDGGNRTAYYPLFIALVFKFFGFNNIDGVRIAQAFINTLAGVLVFVAVWKISKNYWVALLCLFLSLVSPISGSYGGLYLTEILSTFTTAAVLVCSSSKKPNYFFWGMTVGLWGTVRIAFYMTSLVLLIIGILVNSENKKGFIRNSSLTIAGFLLIMIYPWISQYIQLKKITIIPGGSINKYYLYEGWKIHASHEMVNDPYSLPPDIKWSYDFNTLSPQEYDQKADELLIEYKNDVLTHPLDFLYWRIVHIFRMWNKTHLSYYDDAFRPVSTYVIPYVNFIFLLFGLYGYIYMSKDLWEKRKVFFVSASIMLGISTAFFALKPPEERLTVPLYPIVYIFAGYGIYQCIYIIRTKSKTIQLPVIRRTGTVSQQPKE